jgi:hypothetical protein
MWKRSPDDRCGSLVPAAVQAPLHRSAEAAPSPRPPVLIEAWVPNEQLRPALDEPRLMPAPLDISSPVKGRRRWTAS